ncbi:MAG: TolC family protein [Pirellulales bacterium]|nr:TolC family protein [Pirellulales bacterium]
MQHLQLRNLLVGSLVCLAMAMSVGCRSRGKGVFRACTSDDCYHTQASEIEYPQVSQCSATCDEWAAAEPLTLTSTSDPEYWDVPLEQVVQLALAQSKVLRDLGGAVLRNPSSTQTFWNPALQETDPRFGIEAALSAFDAQFSTSVFGEKNDKALNNEFFGGGTRILQQDAFVSQTQFAKRAVTGSEFMLRHNLEYDANNAPSNQFPSAWNVNIESEFRHPLLQGSGMLFNRIAGPSETPGVYGGVLIARVNTDVGLADFELAVCDLVSNIENSYWDLYYAYRDLDAKITARNAALDTWRRVHALFEAGRRGGEAEKEAQAREQFFRFQEEVQNALSGRLVDGTRTGNGSSGGTFRGAGGVHVTERRLRRIIGLPPSDGRLLRPTDQPLAAPIKFDWCEVTREAVLRRVELRRQRFETRRRELELIASKNHLLPSLDAVGRYRWRGFGRSLLDNSSNNPRFDNAYEDLTSGDFQEWQLGLELNVPIGYRRAFAANRHAKMQLTRARAILREQEHHVLHEVADAVAEMDRAYQVSQTSFNRLDAARQQLAAVEAAFEADKAPLDLLLDGQRRLADADSRHFRALAEYAIAVKNVHFAKGTLLDYDGVFLSEGAWPCQAHQDAAQLESRRGRPKRLNYSSAHAPQVSCGTYEQLTNEGLPPAERLEILTPVDLGANSAEPSPKDSLMHSETDITPQAPAHDNAGDGPDTSVALFEVAMLGTEAIQPQGVQWTEHALSTPTSSEPLAE